MASSDTETYKAKLEDDKPKRSRAQKPEDVEAEAAATVEPATPEQPPLVTPPIVEPAMAPPPEQILDRDEKPKKSSAKDDADAIKLGRIGHYSYQQACQTAMVVRVREDGRVNLVAWDQTGDTRSHGRVDVAPPDVGKNLESIVDGKATFHLNRQCPWGR
jgi:hypothetical protein